MVTAIDEPRMRMDCQPRDLPATPDDIDMERIVDDPEYRHAVKELLKRWGLGNDSGRS